MKKINRILILTLLFAFPAFCLNAFADHIKFEKVSDRGNSYELIIGTETPDVMKPIPVVLNITATDGSPVSGANITCSLTMSAMAMPLNTPTFKETETPGQYKSIFLLTMGGLWVAEITSSFQAGESDYVEIPIPDVSSRGAESAVDSKLEELFHEKSQKK